MSSSDVPLRQLLITADDFGVGLETSRGILDLGRRGSVSSTVLLVNSPFAEESVQMWRAAGEPVEMGWHPCLTIDAPILPARDVPSLVTSEGRFPRLGELLKRLIMGRIEGAQVEAEFRAQYQRFRELTGLVPANVNAHHHVHVFQPIGEALTRVLADVHPRPFVRRVVETVGTLGRIPGARVKRAFLTYFGRAAGQRQVREGLVGNDSLIGITDPPYVHADDFFGRWLRAASGQFVELSCHPGYLDMSLDGRDGTFADGHIRRRVREFELLASEMFLATVREAGFEVVTARRILSHSTDIDAEKPRAA